MAEIHTWRRCGTCKNPIGLNSKYFACEVSTCRKTVYCSLDCFNDHVPIFRHKDAWATEHMSPSRFEEVRLVAPNQPKPAELPQDVLIVASKLKDYIRAKSGMNTSGNVMDRLSDLVRALCEKAIASAERDGRKTVMDRDFY